MSRARELSELPNGVDVDANGNVGIGTNTPSGYNSKLAVLGNIAMANTQSRFYPYYISSTNHAYVSSTAGGDLTFGTGLSGVSERMRVDTAGRVTKPNQPTFRAFSSTTLTPSNGTTAVFNSVVWNVGSGYNTSNGRFTAPVAGYYVFFACARPASIGSPTEYEFRKNDSRDTLQEQTSSSTTLHQTLSAVIYLAVNDYVTVQAVNNMRWDSAAYNGFSGYLLG